MNIKNAVGNIISHWKTPAAGKIVPYREYASYSVGGIGVSTLNSLFAYAALSANCLLMGSVYGIKPTHLAMMNIIMGIISIAKTPFISMLIDNTNSRLGKFRPYLLYAGFPAMALIIIITFIPIGSSYSLKCFLIGTVYALLMTFQSLYYTAFTSLAQVMTPDSDERTSMLSISSFIFNLGPSLVNLLLPILASLTGGLTSITTYRVLFPIFAIAGVLIGLLTVRGTNERLIVPPDYVAKVRFRDGIMQVSKNKYFWIINFSAVFGALKLGINATIAWYCVYSIKNDTVLGIMNSVMGTAYVPGMLLAPLLVKKIGKRNAFISGNLLHALFAFFMLLALDKPVIYFICLYISTIGIGPDSIITQSMLADAYDYQQLKTGTRLEGFMTQFGNMLVTAFGFASGLILPFIYEHYGLVNDYSVLYSSEVRTPIFNALIITTIASSLFAVVPMLFNDLSEKKHRAIIEELQIKANT